MGRGGGWRERVRDSFITGGEDGYVRLCFFDPEYFTMDETNERNLRELEELSKKQCYVCLNNRWVQMGWER